MNVARNNPKKFSTTKPSVVCHDDRGLFPFSRASRQEGPVEGQLAIIF